MRPLFIAATITIFITKVSFSQVDYARDIAENLQRYTLILPDTKMKEIQSLCLSKDNRFLLSSGSGNGTCLWDIKLGKLLRRLDASGKFLAIDDKSSMGLVCSAVGIYWFNLIDGSPIGFLPSPGLITSATLSPDGKYAAIGVYDRGVLIIDLTKSKLQKEIKGYSGSVLGLTFIKRGEILASASAFDGIKFIRTSDWDTVKSIRMEDALIKSICFDEAGTFSFYNQGADEIYRFDLDLEMVDQEYVAKSSIWQMPISFSADGKVGATGSDEGQIEVWDFEINDNVLALPAHQGQTLSVVISRDGRTLISGGQDGYIKIWDINAKKLLRQLNAPGFELTNIYRDKDQHAVWYGVNKQANLIDLDKGMFDKRVLFDGVTKTGSKQTVPDPLAARVDQLTYVEVDTSGHFILAANRKSIMVKDIRNDKKVKTITGKAPFTVTPDLKRGIITDPTGEAYKFYDLVNSKPISKIVGAEPETVNPLAILIPPNPASIIKISKDGKSCYTAYKENRFVMLALSSGLPVKDFKSGDNGQIKAMEISADETRAAVSRLGGAVEIWDLVTAKLLFRREPATAMDGAGDIIKNIKMDADMKKMAVSLFISVNAISATPDFKWLLMGSMSGEVSLLNMVDKKTEISFTSDYGPVKSLAITEDGNYGYALYGNNAIMIFDLANKKHISTFISIGENDFVLLLPSGFYTSTKDAAKQMGFVNGMKYFGFEQLDIKYNRPDKVLEALGNKDTDLINSYRLAYYKRLRKMQMDTTQFTGSLSVPEADFKNRDDISYEQQSNNLQLQLKGNDSHYTLDRFNVWVNETPLFGQRGIDIRKRNKTDFDTTITIKLSQGENKVETSITNVNGTESYRMPLSVNYSPSIKQKESIRFIGIGIDQFADSKYNLQYSAKDIRDLSKKLKNKYKTGIIIDTLFNDNVTVSNVKALKQKLQTTTENDKVIIAYSGHGLLSKDYDYYLSTYSVNFDKPEENGLPYEELESLLDSIPARKKLLLIDACHSGEVDKEDLVTLTASSDSLIKGLKPVAYKKEGQLGLKNSFELMQSLFVNVGKSTGATIISAAAGTQFALERNDLKNGVFTYSILEAMNKYPTLKISELKKIVGERVEELTKGLQKPTSRNETIAVDWEIW